MAEKSSLTALARQPLELARHASSGRSAHTVFGGHEHVLRQTLIALAAGYGLDEHDSPGEATLHVLHGRVRLTCATSSWESSPGDLLIIPDTRHSLSCLLCRWWRGSWETFDGCTGQSTNRRRHRARPHMVPSRRLLS